MHPDQSDLLLESRLSLYGQETSQSDISDKVFKSPANGSASEKFGIECFSIDDLSPPTSPVIKGVVEKSDSVSWVLEINDDESGEALASRMVRRAGSFRSSFNEKHSNSYLSPIAYGNRSANALSQSASATSILRQHSETVTSPLEPVHSTPMRSKSASIKSEPKMIVRSNSSAAASSSRKSTDAIASSSSRKPTDVIASSWNERCAVKRSRNNPPMTKDNCNKDTGASGAPATMSTSMPKNRIRSNSIDGGSDDTADTAHLHFRRTPVFKPNKRGLITCNMAALTSQRSELLGPTLPTHPSVQDLKKCQQIKESAGEAMVSGTNSEDEDGSMASSDDSLSAGSSHSDGSSPSDRHHSSMDYEFMHIVVASLDGTPMEVSWSEDNDHYPNESVV